MRLLFQRILLPLFSLSLFMTAGLHRAALAADLPEYRRVTVVPSEISFPRATVQNTQVPITLAGTFSDTCWRFRYSAAGIDARAKMIMLFTEAAHFESSWCLYVMVPYESTVHITPEDAGNYRVYVVNENGQEQYTGMDMNVLPE